MRRIGKIIVIVMVMGMMIIPEIAQAKEYKRELRYVSCGEATGIPAEIPQLTSAAYTLLLIGTPIVLIIFSIIAMVKAITAGNQEDIVKARNKLIKKFIAAAIVFFVAGIVQFVVTKASDASEKDSVIGCVNCFLYNDDCSSVPDSGNGVSLPTGNSNGTNSSSGNNSGNSTSESNTSNTDKGTKNIIIGDSRTVGMCNLSSNCNGDVSVAKDGGSYNNWFSTAQSTTNSTLNSNPKTRYNILVFMGINDIGNYATYLDRLKSLATTDWKNQNIIFISLTPIDEAKLLNEYKHNKQSNIDTFNDHMKNGIASSKLKNLSYCDIATDLNVSGRTTDGIHYKEELYKEVYNRIKSRCL